MNNQPILAMGADLKAAFAMDGNDMLYISPSYGDMSQYPARKKYKQDIIKYMEQSKMQPAQIICDRHPGYVTRRMAYELAASFDNNAQVTEVGHHHAHVASVMAENKLTSCIGIAFDGTGYGDDATVWGSEILVCNKADVIRAGHLLPVPMCGGDTASQDAVLAAINYIMADDRHNMSEAVRSLWGKESENRALAVHMAQRMKVNTVISTSTGRLFDAVSAILGIELFNRAEGQCAIALERRAQAAIDNGYAASGLSFDIYSRKDYESGNDVWVADWRKLIADIVSRRDGGDITVAKTALGFHYAVAQAAADICRRIRNTYGIGEVALSGGVFANKILSERCSELLMQDGFKVYKNSRVPCSDAGIALGQAWLAKQRS